MNVNDWITAVRDGEVFTHALVIKGAHGSGKGVAVRLLETAFTHVHSVTVNASYIGSHGLFNALATAVTETDLVTVDDVCHPSQIDIIKQIVSERFIRVQVRGKGEEIRTPKANLIVTTAVWSMDEPGDQRRFIVTTPIELIASLIPFLAR
ncbi:hypothetical protein EVB39_009 [Rhizobium phage RHph_TM3_3_9]|nr:hypothetical protein EVB39_009 [Rhizobium phage RHph_TM3_3_9]QIG67811.1 hypothetical protein EVB53_009 [Rhizobium phage RHph_Y60]QIG68530.1 hypothetical protein EVB66_009 [Rhizobium phage RHph_TM3_3_13]QIG74388.1 hypothetical protein EVC09_008 [Rhizobium phage RHph_TM3_3_10]QXV74501.1 hypothetical protein [Rhizobium phage RHEph19]